MKQGVRFRFESYLLDLGRRELRRDDTCVPIEPQVFDLLVYLVQNRERVISKDELIATVWAGRIVSDSTLASRINGARKAVADTGEERRLIRTYPRKGVRFVGEVREEPIAPDPAPQKAESSDAPRWERGKPSVAVLAFTNLSGDPEQTYFSDGIAEDIITLLGRNRSLVVIARNSSFAFRTESVDVRRVGQALGADYVVEGSVRRIGANVRVSAQLSETQAGRQLWGERYDRGLQDIFAVQDDITRMIAARVEPEVGLAEQHRAARKPRQTFEAWDYFHLGTRAFYRATEAGNREAQELFRRAIELDPELAQAHGFLSYAIVLSMIYFDVEPDAARLDEAIAIARKAVELDDRDAMVRFMYGRALLARGLYADAIGELEEALEMNPSLAVVHCGMGDSLAYEGRMAEALPYFQAAISLSPHDPLRWAFLSYRALAHLFARQFEQAELWAHKATRVSHCHYWGFAHRVVALGHLGRDADIRGAVDELLQVRPDFSQAVARQRLFYVKNPDHVATYIEGLRRARVPETS